MNFAARTVYGHAHGVHDFGTNARADGKPCIDCHKGIAHRLPTGYEDPDEE
ncbi:MAG: NapC/NirT family cytochrome c [Burkholderiaceae bacterium]|nr:NapC/NirT family cytochrome c [Burkholderiaceae bacterium]